MKHSRRSSPAFGVIAGLLTVSLAVPASVASAPPVALAVRGAAAATNVRLWGDNSVGQMAQGNQGSYSDLPVVPKRLGVVKQLSGGGIYAMALLTGGTVKAWGDNEQGELGDGTTTSRDLPVKVQDVSGVVSISAGTETSLALLTNGTAVAWGDNASGELGDGTFGGMSTVPVPVKDLNHLVAVIASENFCFALRDDGTVWAWGDNSAGELGIGSTVNQDLPVEISTLTGVKEVGAGTLHALAVLSNGTVMSWGANSDGMLGTGTKYPSGSDVPVKVDLIHTAVAVVGGYEHSAALLANGKVMSWGSNQDGQLGIGTGNFLESDDPIAVDGLHDATSLCAGAFESQALREDGTVVGWGDDSQGQLGDGESNPEVVAPVQVLNLSKATNISCGGGFGMAIVK